MLAAKFSPNVTSTVPSLRIDDVFVFIALESLGTLAITGNLCLIIVLLKNKYLHRASFILMLSLAIADVIHGVVTTSYFYPPIVLKYNHMPAIGVRIFNILDWTAWSITLTHMSAICLDRLIAIMLYGRYNLIVTVKRIRFFTIFCWSAFLSINTIFIFALRACCLITPLENNQFYTFGYGEFETKAILSISNPITLIQLYRRHKRKIALRIQAPPARQSNASSLKTRSQWQRASTMLLEMSMRMGSKHVQDDVRQLASRRANRQQQRILLQIVIVALLFLLYMATYYMSYHVFDIENKWLVLFNSFFYSTTHMINPVIYFSLNKEMRVQLIKALNDFLSTVCCIQMGTSNDADSQRKQSTEPRSSTKGVENSVTITETSPLFTANTINNNNSLRPTLLVSTNSGVEKLKISEFGASLRRLVHQNSNASTLIKVNINSKTEETVNSISIEEQKIQCPEGLSNGILPNGNYNQFDGHKNSGFIDSNEPNSLGKLTDDSEEDTRPLVDEVEQQSLMKSIVRAMQRIVLFESASTSGNNRTPHSRSLDQIEMKKQRKMKLSQTVHAMTELSRLDSNKKALSKSHSFNNKLNEDRKSNEIDNCAELLHDSLVLLINESRETITVQEMDSQKYTPSCTPEDEIIFL